MAPGAFCCPSDTSSGPFFLLSSLGCFFALKKGGSGVQVDTGDPWPAPPRPLPPRGGNGGGWVGEGGCRGGTGRTIGAGGRRQAQSRNAVQAPGLLVTFKGRERKKS